MEQGVQDHGLEEVFARRQEEVSPTHDERWKGTRVVEEQTLELERREVASSVMTDITSPLTHNQVRSGAVERVVLRRLRKFEEVEEVEEVEEILGIGEEVASVLVEEEVVWVEVLRVRVTR